MIAFTFAMAGAASCIELLSAKSAPVTVKAETTDLFGDKPAGKNSNKEQVWSFAIDVETSDNEMLAGEQSDMFLVPSLNIVLLKTDIVSFDAESCSANKSQAITWTLGSDKNTKVFSWLSSFELEHTELPELRAAAEATDDDAKKQQLTEAISAWEAILKRNKDVRKMAAAGDLERVQALWGARADTFGYANSGEVSGEMNKGIAFAPHDAIDGALNTDGTVAGTQEKDELRSLSALQFSGGGSTYTFAYDYSNDVSVESAYLHKREIQTGVEFSFDLETGGVGADFKITPLAVGELEASNGEEDGYSTETSVSFTLGDPDPSDVFTVEVFKHPDYGTLVFHTASGKSSCPHEQGTTPLEKLSISVSRRPLAAVLPNEPAVFELLLQNDGDSYTDLNLFNLNSENQDGLAIMVDGKSLATPIDFEGFPAGARVVTVVIERGPSKFDYSPVSIGWCVDACEHTCVCVFACSCPAQPPISFPIYLACISHFTHASLPCPYPFLTQPRFCSPCLFHLLRTLCCVQEKSVRG